MKNLFLSLFVAICCSCGQETAKFQFPTDALQNMQVYDVGNAADASDIKVYLNFKSLDIAKTVKEARVIVSKTALTLAQAQTATAGNFSSLSVGTSSAKMSAKLSTSSKDFAGANLAENTAYTIYVLLIGNDNNAVFLSAGTAITLKNKPIYAGNYTGVWNDALFKNFAVSMKLNDDYLGEVFYSANFTVCCPPGNKEDGIAKFVFSGTTITSFSLKQYLGNYKNGHCEATYTADGSVSDDIVLSLKNLQGIDCDGNHAPGTVVFTRMQ